MKKYKNQDENLDKVFEELVKYVAHNGVQKSIKPIFKTSDLALYAGDCLEVLSRFFLTRKSLWKISNTKAA